MISSFIVDRRGEADPVCVCRLAPPSWLLSLLGFVVCKAYVFQWGYDGKQPSIVSLETPSRVSGNQLEDDRRSVCVLSLACIRSNQVDVGFVSGRRWGGSCLQSDEDGQVVCPHGRVCLPYGRGDERG